jgi:hypothetical protein
VRDKYLSKEKIQTVGGSGMYIQHVGLSLICTLVTALHLCNILHAPHATKHLLSVHHFTRDNNVFFEFHPYHFLIKDTPTRIPLLHGRCVSGLYPLCHNGATMWHQRLGHPWSFALQQVLSQNNLLVAPSNKHACVQCLSNGQEPSTPLL